MTRRYGKVVDGIYRDVVAPFGCQRRDYLLACGFSNSIEKYGVKSRAIAALENSRRGFRLSMSGGSHEFEILVDGGTAKLGLVSGPRTTKQLLASGSASASDTWTRFAEIIKAKECK